MVDAQRYTTELNAQLTYLFGFVRRINEIDTVMAVFGEFRGAQDSGWSTVDTAHEVFNELLELGKKGQPLTRAELRQVLCLYTQLSEAGGVYEGLLNVFGVGQLKPYNLWPFQNLVRVRKSPPAIIGPNANAMFRRLAESATAIGMTGLAGLLEETFRDDIRNAMAHADYILVSSGLRIRRRNGGQPLVVSMADINSALQVAINFFQLLQHFQRTISQLFRPARTIIGRFSENPPMPWRIECLENGGISISSDAPAPQTDAAYLRQQRINDRLGGCMVTAYLEPGGIVSPTILADIQKIGFEVQLIDLASQQQYSELVAEVGEHGLWDPAPQDAAGGAVLMVTPMGFRRIGSASDFRALLPAVEELEITETKEQGAASPEAGPPR